MRAALSEPRRRWKLEGAAEDFAWIEPQPEYSAFRESSFGVGLLTFVNDSHAFYNWSRSACGTHGVPGEPGANEDGFVTPTAARNYNINTSAGCATDGDTSAQARKTSDTAWLVRPPIPMSGERAGCTKPTCAGPPTPPPPPKPLVMDDAEEGEGAAAQREGLQRELSGIGVAGWILFAISALGNIVLGVAWRSATRVRRPSRSSTSWGASASQLPEIKLAQAQPL